VLIGRLPLFASDPILSLPLRALVLVRDVLSVNVKALQEVTPLAPNTARDEVKEPIPQLSVALEEGIQSVRIGHPSREWGV
jgi:hypothetical protein